MAPSTVITDTFARAVTALRSASARPELSVNEVAAPQRLAPYAYALGGAVAAGDRRARTPADDSDDEPEVASGRLVLLYDPDGQAGWQGTMRLVSYVTA